MTNQKSDEWISIGYAIFFIVYSFNLSYSNNLYRNNVRVYTTMMFNVIKREKIYGVRRLKLAGGEWMGWVGTTNADNNHDGK